MRSWKVKKWRFLDKIEKFIEINLRTDVLFSWPRITERFCEAKCENTVFKKFSNITSFNKYF